jgi:hypothetical protein
VAAGLVGLAANIVVVAVAAIMERSAGRAPDVRAVKERVEAT